MVNPLKLKKLKIYITKGENLISSEIIDKLAKKEEDVSYRNFLIGLKHISERHFTEAIKWLQLSSCKEVGFLIAVLSLKLADEFLFSEYKEEFFQEDCLKKGNFYIVMQTDKKSIVINNQGAIKPLDVISLLEL